MGRYKYENNMKERVKKLLIETVKKIKPQELFKNKIKRENHKLIICSQELNLEKYTRVVIAGSGKASVEMAKAFINISELKPDAGLIVSPFDEDLSHLNIEVIKGDHPIPWENSLKAGKRLFNFLKNLGKDDLLIFLLSGGSSALVEYPEEELDIEDLKITTEILLKEGIPINDINAVRKKLSKVKGGKLARITKAKTVVLVLSDVIGNDLSTIGSGPFYPDLTSAVEVIKRYKLEDKLPFQILNVIKKEKQKWFDPPMHIILGSNKDAINILSRISKENGYFPYIANAYMKGEAREVAKVLYGIAKTQWENRKEKLALIFGGETTVAVKGKGKGGRNQELCLSLFIEAFEDSNLKKFAAGFIGTDGIDGNTDVAGAVFDITDIEKAKNFKIYPYKYLKDNDSFNFFKILDGLVKIGPTGTNLCDIGIIICEG